MKMRLVIEIGADGIVRVVDSTPITEHGNSQSATVDAQAKPEAAAESSYGETVKLDQSSPEFAARKEELKKLGYKWDRKEKVWRKPTNANGSKSPAPVAEANWFGDATKIELSQDDPDFMAKKDSLKAAGFRWDKEEKVWRLPG